MFYEFPLLHSALSVQRSTLVAISYFVSRISYLYLVHCTSLGPSTLVSIPYFVSRTFYPYPLL
jgi:hypothetical protein